MKRFLIALALGAASSTFLGATAIVDGDFVNWGFSTINIASVTVVSTGGNPGPRLNITTNAQNGVNPDGYGLAVDLNVPINEALAGNFTLKIDYESGPGDFGAGQGFGLLVAQGSDIYLNLLTPTGCCTEGFVGLTYNGTFTSSGFSHLVGGGSAHPDFSGGTTSYAGFMAYNHATFGLLTQYYDNFNLSYTSTTPEPSTLLMLSFGLGGFGVFRLGCRRAR